MASSPFDLGLLNEIAPFIYIYMRAKFRKVTKIRNLAHDHDVIYIRAKFRKVTKIRNLAHDHDVGM